MAIDFLERHLVCETETKEDHAGYPEEEDIPASFEDGGWVELLEVKSLA